MSTDSTVLVSTESNAANWLNGDGESNIAHSVSSSMA